MALWDSGVFVEQAFLLLLPNEAMPKKTSPFVPVNRLFIILFCKLTKWRQRTMCLSRSWVKGILWIGVMKSRPHGRVYEAEDKTTKQCVAIRIADTETCKELPNQLELLKANASDNLIHFYDVFVHNEEVWVGLLRWSNGVDRDGILSLRLSWLRLKTLSLQ